MPGEKFDAFISYSRSASTELASDLQSGIERFAKPWFRLRASRVFRDDSSMSANTALWGTIEGGLREAGWLILIATPQAAASEYVNNEVAWWVKHKSAASILLVHAGGELTWDRVAGTFSGESDAVPPALRGAYAEEPRWIDLRWYSEPGSLGKADSRFSERVADLAAAVRNQERDSLVGENVRQRRRALNLLRIGIIALSGLLVVSLLATGVAVAQGNEAAVQRDTAQKQARIASARQLAATSQSLLSVDATTAKLLAVYGYQLNADAQTQAALLAAVSTASGDATITIDVGEPVTAMGGPSDASFAILGTESGRVLRWTPGESETTELGKLDGKITAISASDDGTVIAASALLYDENSTRLTPVALWLDGTAVTLPDGAEGPIEVSPSGETVGFGEPLPDGYESKAFIGDSVFGFVRRTGGFADGVNGGIFTPGVAQFVLPDDESVIAWVDPAMEGGEVQVRQLDDFSLTADVQTPGGVPRDHPGLLSPAGDYIVQVDRNSRFAAANPTEIPLYDTKTDSSDPAMFGYAPTGPLEALAISSDTKRFATASAGVIYVSSPRSADQPYEDPLILAGSSSIGSLAFLNTNTLLSASGSAATIRQLDAGNPLHTDVPFSAATLDGAANGMPLLVSLNENGTRLVTVEQGWFDDTFEEAFGSSTWREVGVDEPTRLAAVPLAWKTESTAFVIDDDGLAIYDADSDTVEDLPERTPLVAEDVSGGLVPPASAGRYLPGEDRLYVATSDGVLEIDGTSGALVKSWPELKSAELSPDARFAVTSVYDDNSQYASSVTELSTGKETKIPGVGVFAASYRGPYLAVTPSRQSVTLTSADGKTPIGTFAESFSGPLVVSSDGSLGARFTDDGSMSVISVLTTQVLGEFDIHGDSRAHVGVVFAGDGRTLIGARTDYPSGSYSIIDLDPNNWMRMLCASAGRDFTDAEWVRYTGVTKPKGLGCATL